MKLTISTLLVAAVWAVTHSLTAQEQSFDPLGDEAESNLPRQVLTQVEFIEMSHEQMTALLANPEASKSNTALRKKVTELIQANKAKIIDTQIVITRSGEKSVSESITEFIYPTEYEPPFTPTTAKAENESENKVPKKYVAIPPTPTAFETRNLGSTLEVEPTIGENNRYIDIRLAPEIVYHVGNIKWATWKDEHGETDIQMPTIYALRVTTALTLANKQPCLVAALSPKDDKGMSDFSRKILIFVKCDILFAGR
jgi:hypothetical protein